MDTIPELRLDTVPELEPVRDAHTSDQIVNIKPATAPAQLIQQEPTKADSALNSDQMTTAPYLDPVFLEYRRMPLKTDSVPGCPRQKNTVKRISKPYKPFLDSSAKAKAYIITFGLYITIGFAALFIYVTFNSIRPHTFNSIQSIVMFFIILAICVVVIIGCIYGIHCFLITLRHRLKFQYEEIEYHTFIEYWLRQ